MGCCVRTLLVSVLLILPASAVFALKAPEPGNAVQQPAPMPAETSTTAPVENAVPDKSPAPARPSSEERIQADSAVSFPVDI